MNRKGDKFGRAGVRMQQDGRSRPFFGRVTFRGEKYDTRYYRTADQAALAYEILSGALRIVAEEDASLNPPNRTEIR